MIDYIVYYLATFLQALEWGFTEGMRAAMIEFIDQWVDVVAYGYGDLVQAIVKVLW